MHHACDTDLHPHGNQRGNLKLTWDGAHAPCSIIGVRRNRERKEETPENGGGPRMYVSHVPAAEFGEEPHVAAM
jgi:hypothetical protein